MRLSAPRCRRLLAAWFVLGLLAMEDWPRAGAGRALLPETGQCIRGASAPSGSRTAGCIFGYPIASQQDEPMR